MPLDIIVSFLHSVLSVGGWAVTPENNKRGRIRTIMVKISFVRDQDLQVQDEQVGDVVLHVGALEDHHHDQQVAKDAQTKDDQVEKTES